MDHQQVLKNEIKQYLVSKKTVRRRIIIVWKLESMPINLVKKYLTSPEKVSIAGYLHDISAIYPNNQRISVAQKNMGLN